MLADGGAVCYADTCNVMLGDVGTTPASSDYPPPHSALAAVHSHLNGSKVKGQGQTMRA